MTHPNPLDLLRIVARFSFDVIDLIIEHVSRRLLSSVLLSVKLSRMMLKNSCRVLHLDPSPRASRRYGFVTQICMILMTYNKKVKVLGEREAS